MPTRRFTFAPAVAGTSARRATAQARIRVVVFLVIGDPNASAAGGVALGSREVGISTGRNPTARARRRRRPQRRHEVAITQRAVRVRAGKRRSFARDESLRTTMVPGTRGVM